MTGSAGESVNISAKDLQNYVKRVTGIKVSSVGDIADKLSDIAAKLLEKNDAGDV